jgi:hypothetical protein
VATTKTALNNNTTLRHLATPPDPTPMSVSLHFGRVCGRSASSVAVAILAAWGVATWSNRMHTAPGLLLVSAESACFEAKARAETIVNSYACGQAYPHTCSICLDNYDGEGADVATCTLDYEICSSGVCGTVTTAAVWKGSIGLYVQTLDVVLTKGLQGRVVLSFSYDPSSGYLCSATVNAVECGACAVRTCDSSDRNSTVASFVDCTNLGQGTIDYCETTDSGSAGDMLKFLRLPDTCGSGGDGTAGDAVSAPASGATPAATPTTMEATPPTSGAAGPSFVVVLLLWMMTLSGLVSGPIP